MKALFMLLVVVAPIAFAGPQDKDTIKTSSTNFEIHEDDLEELQKSNKVVVERVRLPRAYVLGGADMFGNLQNGMFVGVGVRDDRGIISGELQWRYNAKDSVGQNINDTIGAGLHGYLRPFRLFTGPDNMLGNLVIGAGSDKYEVMKNDPTRSNMKSSVNREIGWDLPNARFTLGREDRVVQNPLLGPQEEWVNTLRIVIKGGIGR